MSQYSTVRSHLYLGVILIHMHEDILLILTHMCFSNEIPVNWERGAFTYSLAYCIWPLKLNTTPTTMKDSDTLLFDPPNKSHGVLT